MLIILGNLAWTLAEAIGSRHLAGSGGDCEVNWGRVEVCCFVRLFYKRNH